MIENKAPLEPLHKYFCDVRLARASELAVRGRLREAFDVLYPKGEYPHDERELHLLGKIAIRLREYTIAQKCWELACKISPNNKNYPICLEYVLYLKSKPTLYASIKLSIFKMFNYLFLRKKKTPLPKPSVEIKTSETKVTNE